MKRFSRFLLCASACLPLLEAPAALAQRRIIGAADEEAPPEEEPAGDAPPADKKGKDGKKGDAAKDKKGDTAKDKKGDAAKDKKGDAAKDKKGDAARGKAGAKQGEVEESGDVLDGTREDRERRAKEEAARAAAARAAEEAAEAERKKKEEEQKRVLEERKAAEQKRRLENRDQRLAAARKVRGLTRSSGDVTWAVAIEPGEVRANEVLEIRADLVQKLEVADPRFGQLAPLKGLSLVATVVLPTAKKEEAQLRYALHPVDAAGRYGFHFTPPRDGQYRVTIDGETKDGESIRASFPVHVGVWPPPDFDEEEKNNMAATDAARAGRKVLAN